MRLSIEPILTQFTESSAHCGLLTLGNRVYPALCRTLFHGGSSLNLAEQVPLDGMCPLPGDVLKTPQDGDSGAE